MDSDASDEWAEWAKTAVFIGGAAHEPAVRKLGRRCSNVRLDRAPSVPYRPEEPRCTLARDHEGDHVWGPEDEKHDCRDDQIEISYETPDSVVTGVACYHPSHILDLGSGFRITGV
jgi:hypothetical protein